VRFSYGFPLAILYVTGLAVFGDLPVPRPHPSFFAYATLGGLAQIFATALLIRLFAFRNFSVGTTYSKTETVQTALFGLIILGESLSAGAMLGISISLVGVMAISVAKTSSGGRNLVSSLMSKPALIGIASGGCFGIAAVSYRAASLSLGGSGFLMQAGFTLAVVTVMQTLAMAAYMRLREPGVITQTLRHWRVAAWVGASGVAASACWFSAMTIQNAAYVRALGQVELVFTFIVSAVFFRERTTRLEITGISLTVAGILCLLILR